MKKGMNLRIIFGFLYLILGAYFLNLFFGFIDISQFAGKVESISGPLNLIVGALLVISAFLVFRKKRDNYRVGPPNSR